jgi:hypothetical protein
MDKVNRRTALFVSTAIPLTVVVGCTQSGQLNMTEVVQIIAGVQEFVAKACFVYGHVVPEARAILSIIELLTAPIVVLDATLSIGNLIAGAVCAKPVPTPTPQFNETLGPPPPINVKGVQVAFIAFH